MSSTPCRTWNPRPVTHVPFVESVPRDTRAARVSVLFRLYPSALPTCVISPLSTPGRVAMTTSDSQTSVCLRVLRPVPRRQNTRESRRTSVTRGAMVCLASQHATCRRRVGADEVIGSTAAESMSAEKRRSRARSEGDGAAERWLRWSSLPWRPGYGHYYFRGHLCTHDGATLLADAGGGDGEEGTRS